MWGYREMPVARGSLTGNASDGGLAISAAQRTVASIHVFLTPEIQICNQL